MLSLGTLRAQKRLHHHASNARLSHRELLSPHKIEKHVLRKLSGHNVMSNVMSYVDTIEHRCWGSDSSYICTNNQESAIERDP